MAIKRGIKKGGKELVKKAAKWLEGAGDMSEPGLGRFRAGQKSRRSSSATTSNQAMSKAEKDALARKKAARGSKAFYDQAVKDKAAGKKLSAAQKDILKTYHKEMRPPSPKRKVSKKKAEDAAKLKKYAGGGKVKVAAVPDWMKGLSEDEISEILGGPTRQPDGTKRHTKRKKNKPHKKKVVVRTAAAGGQMNLGGLYPQEEGRKTGVLPQAQRKRYARGGKVEHNTSRMNRLEELGRLDAEHADTSKGRRNLRAEKKRVVAEIKDGNKFVAHFYD